MTTYSAIFLQGRIVRLIDLCIWDSSRIQSVMPTPTVFFSFKDWHLSQQLANLFFFSPQIPPVDSCILLVVSPSSFVQLFLKVWLASPHAGKAFLLWQVLISVHSLPDEVIPTPNMEAAAELCLSVRSLFVSEI